jgi:branched-chain amino acid transport system ATP-binding protein
VSDAVPTAPAPAAPLLALEDVSVRFGGVVALDGVSLELRPDEVHGLIGPNGAGKTTIFNVLCGFVPPSSGTVLLAGRPARRLRPHDLTSAGVARTVQGVGLFGGLTVLENVLVGAEVRARSGFASHLAGLPRSDRDEARLAAEAQALLDSLGIAGLARRPAASLAYPDAKRVALARALLSRPRLLLLDEPAGGLGEADIMALGRLVRELPARGTGVVLVEHHMELVLDVCDRVTVLDFGRVVATGTPDQVRDDPAVAEAYLGDAA